MNLEDYVGKKVKIIDIENHEFIGKAIGYVQALDNEPEIDEIDILNELDNKNYSLFENEIKSIEVIE